MTSTSEFANRTALITGAASGIGAACARWLNAAGIGKLHLVDPNRAGLEALKLDCDVEIYAEDVSDEAFWDRFDARELSLDHTIVNAGIGGSGAVADLAFEEWRRVMAVNLDGAFLTLRSGLRGMQRNGSGSAVIVSSSTAVKPIAGIGPYGVAKAAVAHMARIAAAENAAGGIRVNAVAPGGVDTAIWEGSPEFVEAVAKNGREASIKAMASTTPSGRFATADECAENICYLLSDKAANITGTVLVNDGGFTL